MPYIKDTESIFPKWVQQLSASCLQMFWQGFVDLSYSQCFKICPSAAYKNNLFKCWVKLVLWAGCEHAKIFARRCLNKKHWLWLHYLTWPSQSLEELLKTHSVPTNMSREQAFSSKLTHHMHSAFFSVPELLAGRKWLWWRAKLVWMTYFSFHFYTLKEREWAHSEHDSLGQKRLHLYFLYCDCKSLFLSLTSSLGLTNGFFLSKS